MHERALPQETHRAELWRTVVPAWVVSRLVVAVGLLIGTPADGGVLSGFVAWDGKWYLHAARLGYGGAPVPGVESPWPFFPALPFLLRGADAVGLPASATLVIVNHALLLVAMVGVWRLAERRLGAEVATWSVWALALFPMTGVFSMLYPSSLFLAASVWAFELAERRRWVGAGLAAGVAAMVRANGVLAVAVLVVAVLATARGGERVRRGLAVVGPAAVLLVLWLAYSWHRAGDPFVFVTSKSAWEEDTAIGAVRRLLTDPDIGQVTVHLSLGLAAALAVWFARGRLPRSWRVLAALALGLPLVTGVVGLGRYANECFPIVVAAGAVLASLPRRVRVAAAVGSGAASLVAASSMAAYQLLP